jgi:hypothetical protein
MTCPRCNGQVMSDRPYNGQPSEKFCLCCGWRAPVEPIDYFNRGMGLRRREPSHGKVKL